MKSPKNTTGKKQRAFIDRRHWIKPRPPTGSASTRVDQERRKKWPAERGRDAQKTRMALRDKPKRKLIKRIFKNEREWDNEERSRQAKKVSATNAQVPIEPQRFVKRIWIQKG